MYNPKYAAVKILRVLESCKTEEHRRITLEWAQLVDLDIYSKWSFYCELEDLRKVMPKDVSHKH